MLKTSFKAFVYSFSVSLFAIVAANRGVNRGNMVVNQPLNIEDKNIVLFLKKSIPIKSPSQKIALDTLPDIIPKVDVLPSIEPEVIFASELNDFDFPLEFAPIVQHEEVLSVAEDNEIMPAEVLYAPNKSLDTEQIEAEVVYQPEVFAAQLPALESRVSKENSKENTVFPEILDTHFSKEEVILANARNAKLDPIPLSKGGNSIVSKQVNIGNPSSLNSVAMSSVDVPIQSVEKVVASVDVDGVKKEGVWQSLNDSSWLIAKSSGSKNLMNVKEFGSKTNQEVAKVLDASVNRVGVNIASDTVKNLVIPIPEDIMKKDDLTPKLAYPASSEDVEKEKVVKDKIEKQMQSSKAEDKKTLLVKSFDESIPLDNFDEKHVELMKDVNLRKDMKVNQDKSKEKDGEVGIMGALNSIFGRQKIDKSNAKEEAIVKARVKRNAKKRMVKNRPVSIMPTEMRLSFQPNKAEISGQTLQWVQAFAAKAAETPNMSLEIRIDGASAVVLQQRRLNLLHNILTNKGVDYSRINTVFTSREPNSFILRTINSGEANDMQESKNNNRKAKEYIQW